MSQLRDHTWAFPISKHRSGHNSKKTLVPWTPWLRVWSQTLHQDQAITGLDTCSSEEWPQILLNTRCLHKLLFCFSKYGAGVLRFDSEFGTESDALLNQADHVNILSSKGMKTRAESEWSSLPNKARQHVNSQMGPMKAQENNRIRVVFWRCSISLPISSKKKKRRKGKKQKWSNQSSSCSHANTYNSLWNHTHSLKFVTFMCRFC